MTGAVIDTEATAARAAVGTGFDLIADVPRLRATARAARRWGTQMPALPTRVRRARLARALCDPAAPRFTLLVAPAGYGKTALLSEWADLDDRPFAWLTLDERDNDPLRLLASVAGAVDAAVGDEGEAPFVVVLDDVHELHRCEAIDALRAVASDLPSHAALALASRTELPLPIARMRVQRLVAEIGPIELAMTRAEAAALLKAADHDLDRDSIELLWHRTEGWPVGLALAALSLSDRSGAAALARFGGADRAVAQYVRDEVLASLSPRAHAFMVGTSVLDTLSGPLCDRLLERTGSASELAALARAGLLVPLDRTDERYRHHRLLGDALRVELRRTDPQLEPVLHRRASAWHRQMGDVERAVDHALLAGDVRDAGDLVWSSVGAVLGQGRSAVVERWLGRFTDAQVASHPALALVAAGCALVRGQGDFVEHWAAAAADAARSMSGDARVVEAGIAIMRAVVTGDGAVRMGEGAARASALQGEDGPWRPLCCLTAGTARHLAGRREVAVGLLEEGARAAAVVAPHVHALCLAQLSVLAFEDGDWEGAAVLVSRARAQVDRHGLGDHAISALAFAVSAVVCAHRGRIDAAQSDLRDAERLQATVTDFAPWYEAELSLLIARAALRLSEVNRARDQMSRAARPLRRIPDAVVLQVWLSDAHAQLDAFTASDCAPLASITAAELRILQFLPTHLSFREIGELTYVSANTVKSQANAVYRKLDVSSRSEAVTRARDCGLLGD